VALAGGLVVSQESRGRSPAAGESEPTTTSCAGLAFQPCGGPPAPGPDGRRCIDQRADYDGDATNGCEAIPDDADGTELGEVEATIVPADDVDTFAVSVDDHLHLTCDGRIEFDLLAPEGMALRLTIEDADGEVLGEVTSADGVPGQLGIGEPGCIEDDGGTLSAVVTPIGTERTGEPYVVSRSGNW
jgi:hypothetical protein